MFKRFFISLLVCFVLVGCKTPDTAAWKAISTTEVVVDGAMKGWADYVQANKGAEWLKSQETTVAMIYGKYRATVDLMYIARIEGKKVMTSKDVQAVSDIADQLVKTIKSYK